MIKTTSEMKDVLSNCLLITWFSLLLSINSTWAQPTSNNRGQNHKLEEAKAFLLSFKNDSALIILNQLEEELVANKKLDSPFGVRVQYRQAEALEKDHKDEVAITKLLHVVEASEKTKQWDILTHANLSLARLHEKIGRSKNCLLNLRAAKNIIDQYEVDSLYPRFAIRISSYHRIYSDVDSSVFYAREVLRTAPKFNLFEEEAVGHLLLGMLLSNNSFEEAVGHFSKAGEVWKNSGDFSGYGYTQNNLSRLYFREGNLEEALRYNDSTLAAAPLSMASGNDQTSLFYTAYKHRAAIFNTLGRSDSAWIYITKGYDLELDAINKKNIEKVIEIDANYKDNKKAKTIEEQKKLIKYERERRYSLIGIIFMILACAAIMSYYYFKLRNANQKTTAQAQIINRNNEELSKSLAKQTMLQSEVHHRVKNNLQVIISLLDLQKEEIEDIKTRASLETMSGRIYSMAAIHEILYQQEDMAQVNLFDYVENLCLHFSNFSLDENKPAFNINIEDQFFNLETCMPVGIIVTELLTNSLKYARVPGKKLEIDIGLIKREGAHCLIYKDNGPGFQNDTIEERDGGLGTYLLNSMSRQLNGHMTSKNDNGAYFEIFFKEKNNPQY